MNRTAMQANNDDWMFREGYNCDRKFEPVTHEAFASVRVRTVTLLRAIPRAKTCR
jgi:hypothetical protein